MPNPLPIGYILPGLKGQYRITRIIASGGMGILYQAEDITLNNRVCAVKEMLDNFLDPKELQEAIKRFDREGELLASLNHPSIPQIFDRFKILSHNGGCYRHYIVMQYFEGENLENLIQQRISNRQGPFPEDQVIKWAEELCEILKYMHSKNVVYRDMKPSNIIITTSGKLALIDFGISRFLQPGQKANTPYGTQGFAGPELYQGQGEFASDIYGLGATLHYLLTLRDPTREPPFTFPSVRSMNSSVSHQTEAVVTKSLQNDIKARYSSVNDFKRALSIGGFISGNIIVCPNPKCRENNFQDDQFCQKCGTPLKKIPKKKGILNWIKGHQIAATITIITIFAILILAVGAASYFYSLSSSYYLKFNGDSLIVYRGKPAVSRLGYPKEFWNTGFYRKQIDDNYKGELDKGVAIKTPKGSEAEVKDEIVKNAIITRLRPLDHGRYFYEKGQYQKCIDFLRGFQDDSLANYFVGMSYLMLSDPDVESATARLLKAKEQGVPGAYEKEFKDGLGYLSSILVSKARKAMYEGNDPLKAENYLTKCLSLDAPKPPRSSIHWELGTVYEAKKDTKNAVGQYELAKRTATDSAQKARAADRLGRVYLEMGRNGDAKREFEIAISLAPTEYNWDMYKWLGPFGN